MIRRLFFPALAAAVAATPPTAPPDPAPLPASYAADGTLRRPAGIERWILVGTSLGLGYSDATEDGPGMFHRVYLEPSAYDRYRSTGRFPDGTMLALWIHRPTRRVPPARSGWSEGEFAALEVAVKDPTRFAGGWGYFDFGAPAVTARPLPGEQCARCHAQHAARDNVFVQFYPLLRDR